MSGPGGRGLDVALVHYAAPPVVGGVERIVGRHASLMADAGHAVRIVAGRGAAQDPRVRFVGVKRADSLHPAVVEIGADLALGRATRQFEELVETLEEELAVALAGSEVVVLHNVASLNRNLALTAALYSLLARPGAPRTILWHHDPAWALSRYRPSLHEGAPWSLLRTPWPGAIQVTISADRRHDLAGLLGLPESDIAVVPGGVDLPDATVSAAAGSPDEIVAESALPDAGPLPASVTDFEPLLLTPARLTPRKNIELAVETVAALRVAGHRAGLVVTGPVDPHDRTEWLYLERLLELRRRLGLDEAVVFLAEAESGPPVDRQLAWLYGAAAAMLLPSLDEGFGLPILEAAVRELPIVCSNLPSLRELARDDAVYIEPDGTAEAAARAVMAAIARGPSAALAGRVRESYSWPAVYARHIAPLLERAAGRASARRPAQSSAATSDRDNQAS